MTARAGGFYNVQPTAPSAGLRGIGRTSGGSYAFQYRLPIWKNFALYAGVWEEWVSYGEPSTTPPSLHAATEFKHLLLEALP